MKIRLKDAQSFEELLLRRGHSKRSFAEVAGIGQRTALQICSGEHKLSPRIAKRVTEALEVEWDDLFVIEKCQA